MPAFKPGYAQRLSIINSAWRHSRYTDKFFSIRWDHNKVWLLARASACGCFIRQFSIVVKFGANTARNCQGRRPFASSFDRLFADRLRNSPSPSFEFSRCEPMWTESFIVAAPELGIDSLVLDCCSIGCCEEAATTTAFGLGGSLWLVSGVRALDCDEVLLFEVRSFLCCKTKKLPIPRLLQRAWDVFHGRYAPLIHREVKSLSHPAHVGHEHEDLVQEIWKAIVAQLPKLVYDARRGSLCHWLKGVVRRRIGRLKRRPAPWRMRADFD